MLQMPQQQFIKFLREQEGCSIQEIADRVQVNWRTAKKYADRDNWNRAVKSTVHKHPVMEPYVEIIDTWLIEDERLTRKQRHTAARIYNRLKNEHGFTGSDRTVRNYVSKRRKQLQLERAQRYERLEHPGGEAQVDFGTIQVSQDNQLKEYKVLFASFPYSNAAFAYPVPKENQECFLEGMKRLFEQMGGVPRRIWFDNLSAAVVAVESHGKRQCTDAFLRFSAHYRFEPVFCNPASGNEKGHVENKVGYGRRNWCVPPPVFESHDGLAKELAERALADRQRSHYAKSVSIESLWEEEQAKLLHLPDEPYEVFRLEQALVNNYGEVRFETATLSIPQSRPGDTVWLKISWDTIDVLDSLHRRLAQFPRPYMQKSIEIDWKAVLDGFKRRPRAVTHSYFAGMMPPPIRAFLSAPDLIERKKHISSVRQWLERYSLCDIAAALGAEAADSESLDSLSPERIEHRLYKNRHPEFRPIPFAEPYTPAEIIGRTPDLQVYNRLAALGGEAR
ncbi:IS21 family transposase [Heliobacterium undosum]|uniref:IS21 family transposase n=1 Tax=Heliomicrobium undosum TaxID=121734 RepID=A0A845L475_9FIRM|nr:IS21 family transposase [Heliomicrobium undosum]MZP31452.1 IS21 family transposase [Heliomicrobium undosum]